MRKHKYTKTLYEMELDFKSFTVFDSISMAFMAFYVAVAIISLHISICNSWLLSGDIVSSTINVAKGVELPVCQAAGEEHSVVLEKAASHFGTILKAPLRSLADFSSSEVVQLNQAYCQCLNHVDVDGHNRFPVSHCLIHQMTWQ